MLTDKTLYEKIEALNEITMQYEVSVQAFNSDNCPKEFYDFYEIKNRNQKLIPSPYSFDDALRELSGYEVWQTIAEKTNRLFGEPKGVTVFEDIKQIINEIEGADGLAPFFFVFDIMFCEYENFTICFISGTNN